MYQIDLRASTSGLIGITTNNWPFAFKRDHIFLGRVTSRFNKKYGMNRPKINLSEDCKRETKIKIYDFRLNESDDISYCKNFARFFLL